VNDPAFGPSGGLAGAQIVIVGLGLMGGSLAGALQGQCQSVIGVARREETVEAALERGLIDRGTTNLQSGVQRANVVVLATPVRAITRLLDEIAPLLPADCLVMDLGSTKAQIINKMASLPEHIQPVGGHPMCGKETAGIVAADSGLFRGCTFVLTPLPRTSAPALELAHALVEAIGARPLLVEANLHDQVVATISHLPYALACALVATADNVASTQPVVWELAASGYRDTSRLAGSDVTMMLDILLTNRNAVLEALNTYSTQLRELASLIREGDVEGLRDALTLIRECRAET
jgi:prephenate dehydrogenase